MKITTTQTILKPTATIKHQKKAQFLLQTTSSVFASEDCFCSAFLFFAQVVRQLTFYLTGQSGFLL